MRTFAWTVIVFLWSIIFFYAGVFQTKQNYLHTCIAIEPEVLVATIQHEEGVTCIYIHTYGKHYFLRKAT